jgi:hypothetical protein
MITKMTNSHSLFPNLINFTLKFFFLGMVFLIPILSFSQSIKSNEVDPFTNERTIETTLVSLKGGLSSGFGVSYFAVNNSYYLNVLGYSSSDFTITQDDKIWLVLEDGNVVHFNNRAEVETSETADKNVFIHHFFANLTDIEILKNKQVAIVRVSASGGKVTDIKISKKSSKALQKLNEVFFNEVNKSEL